jgi:hypothetical protein
LRDLTAFSSDTLDLKTVSDFVQMKGIYDWIVGMHVVVVIPQDNTLPVGPTYFKTNIAIYRSITHHYRDAQKSIQIAKKRFASLNRLHYKLPIVARIPNLSDQYYANIEIGPNPIGECNTTVSLACGEVKYFVLFFFIKILYASI